jgi:hypothetical protein
MVIMSTHPGEDLENWTLAELIESVAAFQTTNQPLPEDETAQDADDTVEPARRKHSKSAVILEDSDDEDIKYQPEIRTRERGATDAMHEEFIGRSSAGIDIKPVESSSYESESEKKRKTLLAVALDAKKATIEYDVTTKCIQTPGNEITIQKSLRVSIVR